MLRYVNSDLFSSPARVLVNTVNTVGVMGKGIALEFKKRHPEMYEAYRDLCHEGSMEIGRLFLWKGSARWVLNFPTKKHWRNKSRPEWIEAGLKKFASSYREQGIDSISFPLLGCGNGELAFETEVRPLMEHYLSPLPIPIYIHLRTEPNSFVPEHEEPDLFSVGVPDSFPEFWRQLRQLSERNPELHTFTTRSPFRLALVTDENLIFLRGESRVHIPRKDLWDLWNKLRMVGSIKSTDAPGRIGREYSLVFPLLAQLPYIDPIQMADNYSELRDRPLTGLQIRFEDSIPSEPSAERVPVG